MFNQMFPCSRSHAIRKCLKAYTIRANRTTGFSIVPLAVDDNLRDDAIQMFLDKKLGNRTEDYRAESQDVDACTRKREGTQRNSKEFQEEETTCDSRQ